MPEGVSYTHTQIGIKQRLKGPPMQIPEDCFLIGSLLSRTQLL